LGKKCGEKNEGRKIAGIVAVEMCGNRGKLRGKFGCYRRKRGKRKKKTKDSLNAFRGEK